MTFIGLMAELLDQAQLLLDRVDHVSPNYGQEIRESKTGWVLFSTKSEKIVKKIIEEGLMLRVNR